MTARQQGSNRSTGGRSGPDRTRRRRARRRRRLAIVLGALVLLLVAGVGLAFIGHDDQVVPAAVSVAGRDVSGASTDELRATVTARADELMAQPVVITRAGDADFELKVTRRSLGARPLIGRAVSAAAAPRTAVGRLASRLQLAPRREVSIDFALDPVAVDRLVVRANRGFSDPPVGATLRIRGGAIEVIPGESGTGIDETQLRREIAQLPERIDLAVGEQEPPVDVETAEEARRRALDLVAEPIAITFQDRGVPVAPAVLQKALRFDSRPPAIAVRFDPTTIYRDIAPAFAARETAARDAKFQVRGDRVRLIPSAEGRSLDMDAIVAAMAVPPANRSVRARFTVTSPKVLTEELKPLGITEQVGSFSTPYNCCEPRVTNIKVAAERLDGTILAPGERISLSDTLGPRTLDNGYVEAPQISGGRLEDGVGGGVSQMATTLFNAAFFAGLKIESHTPHSFYISRYPAGREATISMGGPDLVFVNDWDASLLISATAGDNEVTVRLFSTSFDRRVETTTGEQTDYVEPEIIERVDPTLEPGAREVDQSTGAAGFSITYTRTVYQGERVRSEETFRWRYSPQNAFVRIGPESSGDDDPDATDEPGTTTGEGTTTSAPPTTPAPTAPPATPATPAPTPGGSAPPPPDLP